MDPNHAEVKKKLDALPPGSGGGNFVRTPAEIMPLLSMARLHEVQGKPQTERKDADGSEVLTYGRFRILGANNGQAALVVFPHLLQAVLQEKGANGPPTEDTELRRRRAEAGARILEIQKRVKPDPEGWTSRDYINHGRR